MAEESMRIDKFLWYVRLAHTRTKARDLAQHGRLRLDGRIVDRPAHPVRVGSVLTMTKGGAVRVIRVEALPLRRGPATESRACISDIASGG